MIKLLIGGSPCTYWSIAQKNNRETEPSGMGWELFKNYLVAKEKFKPDFFLYENNKSAAQAIKDEIKKRLNVWDGTLFMQDSGARYIEINSALVSAQNRQRFYVHNCGEVEQPKDRGILLKDILKSGQGWTDKSYAMTASYDGAVAWNTLERHQRTMVAEPVCVAQRGRYADTGKRSKKTDAKIEQYFEARGDEKTNALTTVQKDNLVAEPVIFQLPHGYNNGGCKYDKSPTLTANAAWQENNKVVEPVCIQEQVFGRKACEDGSYDRRYEARQDGKSGSLTGTNRQNAIAEPVRVGDMGSKSQGMRIYDINGKSVCLNANGGGLGAKTGLYAIPLCYGAEAVEFDEKGKPTKARSCADGKIYAVYEVCNGQITIKGNQYPIKLADGFYIIRKLTVTECCRLQTMPGDYCRAVSATQGYRGLGNGWTAEVIIHILSNVLKDVPKDEEIVVLSMYDGIGTGRYCLDKMGFTNVKYYAYEIDKFAMQVAMSNYPDIVQCGDAFQVRQPDWKLN